MSTWDRSKQWTIKNQEILSWMENTEYEEYKKFMSFQFRCEKKSMDFLDHCIYMQFNILNAHNQMNFDRMDRSHEIYGTHYTLL